MTAVGGAVAVVRISGPDAFTVADSMLGGWPTEPESHRAYFVQIPGGGDAVALVFEPGRGFTGEASVEISVSGSPAVVVEVLALARGRGARMAEPGEFSYRAFMNGRIDLTAAEGIRDLAEAQSALERRNAASLLQGELKSQVSRVRQIALTELAAIEASTDFSEEIGEYDAATGRLRASQVLTDLNRLLATEAGGRILRQGLRIAIVGPPNAGKSSLMNALLGADRVIVAPTPGTTRDFVEEYCDLGGVRAILTDTGGLREAADEIEAEGIRRALEVAEAADWVWFVFDGSLGWTQEMSELYSAMPSDRTTILANKSDLLESDPPAGLLISALSGAGLRELRDLAVARFGLDQAHVFIRERHVAPLKEASAALREVVDGSELPDDVLSTCWSATARALGEITGETLDDQVLQRIFSGFCIGK